MSYSSDTEFLRGEETCAFVYLNRIMFSPKYFKDESLFLKAFIHEINEIEVSMLLKSHGFSDLANIVLIWNEDLANLLESKHSDNDYDFDFDTFLVTHLLSPYGYRCLIGIEENELEW